MGAGTWGPPDYSRRLKCPTHLAKRTKTPRKEKKGRYVKGKEKKKRRKHNKKTNSKHGGAGVGEVLALGSRGDREHRGSHVICMSLWLVSCGGLQSWLILLLGSISSRRNKIHFA